MEASERVKDIEEKEEAWSWGARIEGQLGTGKLQDEHLPQLLPILPSLSFSHSPSSINIADVIRYHVLLLYLSLHDLHRLPPAGILNTTLFQTTGRATNNFGSVNITYESKTNTTTIRSPVAYSQPPNNATVISVIKNLPYNVSIYSVNSLIVPFRFGILASESRPPLINGHNFSVTASMLAASGVVQEFQSDECGAGITLFVPL